MEITEEQIKEMAKLLHSFSNAEMKQKIEQWFPECFKQKLEAGKWYKHFDSDFKEFLFCFSEFGDKNYGFNKVGKWSHELNVYEKYSNKYIKATTEEVESMLKKEAEKRGYKEGDIVISAKDGNKYSLNHHPFSFEYGKLRLGGVCIMSNGKWGTIVEAPKEISIAEAKEIVEKQLGHKVKIVS